MLNRTSGCGNEDGEGSQRFPPPAAITQNGIRASVQKMNACDDLPVLEVGGEIRSKR